MHARDLRINTAIPRLEDKVRDCGIRWIGRGTEFDSILLGEAGGQLTDVKLVPVYS